MALPLSDAGHVFMDLTALLFALLALSLAARPTSDRRTFGFIGSKFWRRSREWSFGGGAGALDFLGIRGSTVVDAIAAVVPMATIGIANREQRDCGVATAPTLPTGHQSSRRFLCTWHRTPCQSGPRALISLTGWTFVDPVVGIVIAR